jgi:spore maturation protein CgeB
MKVVIFCHSLLSDWNHGNAHFLRGLCLELLARGVDVQVYEPADAWSARSLLEDAGPDGLAGFARAYPTLRSHRYDEDQLDLPEVLEGADMVLVHEWNRPDLVRRIGEHHAEHPGYSLFFHDTHHRSVTAPDEMRRYDLTHYDAVLAFGEVVRRTYLEHAAPLPGTKPPTCARFRRASARAGSRAIWSGLETLATTSEPPSSKSC